MKSDHLNILKSFIDGEIDVTSYLKTLEELNRSGIWNELSDSEYKLLSDYYRNYVDMYYGKKLPKLGFFEKLKQRMKGMPDVDFDELKKGTSTLLKNWPVG
jgi:hypothetical protein